VQIQAIAASRPLKKRRTTGKLISAHWSIPETKFSALISSEELSKLSKAGHHCIRIALQPTTAPAARSADEPSDDMMLLVLVLEFWSERRLATGEGGACIDDLHAGS